MARSIKLNTILLKFKTNKRVLFVERQDNLFDLI